MKNSSKKSLPSDYGSEKSDLIPDSENPVPVEIDTSVNQNNDEEYEADFGDSAIQDSNTGGGDFY